MKSERISEEGNTGQDKEGRGRKYRIGHGLVEEENTGQDKELVEDRTWIEEENRSQDKKRKEKEKQDRTWSVRWKEIQDITRMGIGRKYRIGQGRVEEGNTGQDKDGQRKEIQDRTRTDRGRKCRIGQGRIEEGNTGQNKDGQRKEIQDRTRNGKRTKC